MVVVVRKGAIHVGDVEVEVGNNLLWQVAFVTHPLWDVMNPGPSPLDTGCVSLSLVDTISAS